VHAWHPRRRWARRVLAARREIPGVVEASGEVEIHEDGFRAERARPYALVQAGRNPALLERLAAAYRVPVIESGDAAGLLDWCRDHGLGLEDSVVTELLGPEEAERIQRTRRSRARTNAIRMAAMLAAIVLLVVLGLTVATDPPGDRILHGRTGEVHVHH
jgi:hypothetical protein